MPRQCSFYGSGFGVETGDTIRRSADTFRGSIEAPRPAGSPQNGILVGG
jgi:hypothetical protein